MTLSLAGRIIANRISAKYQAEAINLEHEDAMLFEAEKHGEMANAKFTKNLEKVEEFFTQARASLVNQVDNRKIKAERPLERLPEYADPYKLIVGNYDEFTQAPPDILKPSHPFHSAWLRFEAWTVSENLVASLVVEPAYGAEPYRYSLVLQVVPIQLTVPAEKAIPEIAEKKKFVLVPALLSLFAGLSIFGPKDESQPWYSEV